MKLNKRIERVFLKAHHVYRHKSFDISLIFQENAGVTHELKNESKESNLEIRNIVNEVKERWLKSSEV